MPLLFDVTDAEAAKKGAERVAAALGGETLAGLVNNAGIAVPGPLFYLPVEDFRRQLDANSVGQLIVTQALLAAAERQDARQQIAEHLLRRRKRRVAFRRRRQHLEIRVRRFFRGDAARGDGVSAST